MTSPPFVTAEGQAEEPALDLQTFAAACRADPAFVRELVEEGLLQPTALEPEWRFGGHELARVRRILRLQWAFEANLSSVAVMLDLLEETERLRSALLRAGLNLP